MRGRLRTHAELLEEPCEERIVHRIEDDEARVDAMSPVTDAHLVGVSVAAEIVVRLVERHRVAARQQPRARQSRDA
jgi:hypothetical protein